MRLAAVLGIAFLLAACEQPPAASRASASGSTPVGGAVASTEPVSVVPDSCGGACGGSCGGMGSCNGSCGAAATAEAEAPAAVPADAEWTSLHVAGMRCGGCARRVKARLAGVGGVLGVEVDVGKAEVRVATAKGQDARALVRDPITGLGYQVLAN